MLALVRRAYSIKSTSKHTQRFPQNGGEKFSLLVGDLEFFRNMFDCLVVGVEIRTQVSSVTSQHRRMSFLCRRILQEPETGTILAALFSVTARDNLLAQWLKCCKISTTTRCEVLKDKPRSDAISPRSRFCQVE